MNGIPARLAALAATGVLACLLLVGCGGGSSDGDATPAPSFSLSTSSPVPPTSSAPVTPSSSAAAETPEAFVRRWNDLNTNMQNTGNVTAYLAASKSCTACSATAKRIAGYYSAGGAVQTPAWKLGRLHCNRTTAAQVSCTASINYGTTDYTETASAPAKHLAGGTFTAIFSLSSTGDSQWNLSNLEQKPS